MTDNKELNISSFNFVKKVVESKDKMPIYKEVNHEFFKKWTPDMAYILGYIFADGAITIGKRRNYYLDITSVDKELISNTRKILGSNHKISYLKPKNARWQPCYRIQIGSKKMVSDLIKLSVVPNKSLVIKYPEIPKELLGDFIRGYFDGDGSIYLKQCFAKDRNKLRWVFNVRFCSGSPDFLRGLLRRIRSEGIRGGYMYNKKDRGYDLVFSWKKGIEVCGFMYNDILASKYLNRKYKVYQQALKIV